MHRRTREKISKSIIEVWKNEEYRNNQIKKHLGHIISDETRKKMSVSQLGKKRKPCSEETRRLISIRTKEMMKWHNAGKKISEIRKGRKLSDACKLKISNTLKIGIREGKIINAFSAGKKHTNTSGIIFTKDRIKKMSIAGKKLWSDSKYKERVLKLQRIGIQKPTKPEKKINLFINTAHLNFNYVGDGKIWITSNIYNTKFNPDFLDIETKKIIEFDGKYWHNNKYRDILRNNTYLSKGYKLLILNEDDFVDNKYINRILEFTR